MNVNIIGDQHNEHMPVIISYQEKLRNGNFKLIMIHELHLTKVLFRDTLSLSLECAHNIKIW